MKVTSKIAIVLASVVAAASITGVSATWYFSSGAATSSTTELDVEIGEWDQTSLFLNTLIEKINDSDSDLNECIDARQGESSPGSLWEWILYILGLTFTLEPRNYIGSMDPSFADYVDDEIKEFLEKYSNYSYIIDYSQQSEGKMYVYISDSKIGGSGKYSWSLFRGGYYTSSYGTPTVPIGGNRYHVYRTKLEYNNTTSEWEADSNETMVDGYAPSCWYEEMMDDSDATLSQVPSYDIYNWTAIDSSNTQGGSGTAIWTFDGDNTTTAKTAGTTVYYQMQIASDAYYYMYTSSNSGTSSAYSYYGLSANGDSSGTINNYFYNYTNGTAGSSHEYKYNEAGTYTITSDSNVEITVYESSINGSVVGSGTGSATFTATAATTYYIVLSGATEMSLSVELS